MEVGSEFPNDSIMIGRAKHKDLVDADKRYALSGRTALSHIIDDIKCKLEIKRVAMPAYCCGSMIAPFVEADIETLFYSGLSTDIEAVISRVEAVLVLDYFGFIRDQASTIARLSKALRKVLIVDATQTAFSSSPAYSDADYIFVSYRKWFDALCAAVYCRNGFIVRDCQRKHYEYVNLWRQAAVEKEYYLKTGRGDKQHYMSLYKVANTILDKDYVGYTASEVDIEKIEFVDADCLIQKRRTNAEYLIGELNKYMSNQDCRPYNLLYSELHDEDCPLFVPVLVSAESRDQTRKRLIEIGVYCPTHWPINEVYPHFRTKEHDSEISLICDQRYGPETMKREVAAFIKALD